MPNPVPPGAQEFYFFVGTERGQCGYTWRAGVGGTSFYLKPRYDPIAGLKISLHGPDPRHPRAFYWFGYDQSADSRVRNSGGVFGGSLRNRTKFAGTVVAPGVRHAVRFRWPWDLFGPDAVTGPWPGDLKRAATGGIAPAPPAPLVTDVDIYVSDDEPFWASGKPSAAGWMGPLVNKAGQAMTAVANLVSPFEAPTPPHVRRPSPRTVPDRIRGICTGLDATGFLWVLEQWVTKSDVDAAVRMRGHGVRGSAGSQ